MSKKPSKRSRTPVENCFEKNSKHWQTLVGWLRDGAPQDPEDIAKPDRIELFPPAALLEGSGASQQMTVLAHYSDGTTRDVTPLTVFQSSNERFGRGRRERIGYG